MSSAMLDRLIGLHDHGRASLDRFRDSDRLPSHRLELVGWIGMVPLLTGTFGSAYAASGVSTCSAKLQSRGSQAAKRRGHKSRNFQPYGYRLIDATPSPGVAFAGGGRRFLCHRIDVPGARNCLPPPSLAWFRAPPWVGSAVQCRVKQIFRGYQWVEWVSSTGRRCLLACVDCRLPLSGCVPRMRPAPGREVGWAHDPQKKYARGCDPRGGERFFEQIMLEQR
jgi:hypothetical protein